MSCFNFYQSYFLPEINCKLQNQNVVKFYQLFRWININYLIKRKGKILFYVI